ncbi:transmembrane protein 217 [Candoia aspera]|uniref:transmembrane protein 217 n=1 Tax=Candoia aspera TaxID=51853 RepID=UPI002FD8073D
MAIISGKAVVPLFDGSICGIAPKSGSLLAGVYMILVTNMYLIFEFGHLTIASNKLGKTEKDSLMGIIPYCYCIAIVLAFITYPICFYYLYCIYKRITVGLYVYFLWIIFYDIANLVILVLIHRAAHLSTFKVSNLEWFGLASRIPVDCFWLSFVLTYLKLLIEGRSTGRISMKPRQIARQVAEPPKFRLGMSAKRVQW